MEETKRIEPQPGPQTQFLSSAADIVFYGGAAGGGKTFGLLMEPLRHWGNVEFGAVIFRKNNTQVRNKGGLWDESVKLYGPLGAQPRPSVLDWVFPLGMTVKFSHLEDDKAVYDWQGSQIPLLGFDEVTHFSQDQFFYMLTRNRSTCGVKPYVRATCNPDVDSWVRAFIDWWIDEDGFAIPERSGRIRWFIRSDEVIHWGNSEQEIYDQFGNGPEIRPKSFTFISAKLSDNQILMRKDPDYLANLLAQNRVVRKRLLDGNWNVRAAAGEVFKRDWFRVLPAMPANVLRIVRSWDKAATEPSENNKDPDWTRGVKMAKLEDGRYVIMDVASKRDRPASVKGLMGNTASQDGYDVTITVPQDPGAAGKADAEDDVRMLAGFNIKVVRPSKNKLLRAGPLSAQCEVGNVLLLAGDWNEAFLKEAENFDGDNGHDDQIDAAADAFNELAVGITSFDVN